MKLKPGRDLANVGREWDNNDTYAVREKQAEVPPPLPSQQSSSSLPLSSSSMDPPSSIPTSSSGEANAGDLLKCACELEPVAA